MTEIRPAPRAMKNPMDLRRPATTMTPAYASGSPGVCGILGCFAGGGVPRDAGHLNGSGDAQEFEDSDLNPGRVELVPSQAVAGRSGMRVVVVVPAFAERDQRNPPAIAGIIAGFKAAVAPQVRGRIDQP